MEAAVLITIAILGFAILALLWIATDLQKQINKLNANMLTLTANTTSLAQSVQRLGRIPNVH